MKPWESIVLRRFTALCLLSLVLLFTFQPQVTASPGISFSIELLASEKSEYEAGDTVKIWARVKNTGDESIEAYKMEGSFEVVSPSGNAYDAGEDWNTFTLGPDALCVLDGSWEVSDSAKSGWYDIRVTVTVKNGGTRTRSKRSSDAFKVTEEPSERYGDLVGRVTSAKTGRGIRGATVSISGPISESDTTDSYGDYGFRVPTGRYEVTVSASGYEERTRTRTVEADRENRLDFELTPTSQEEEPEEFYTLTVRIREEGTSTPIEAAKVYLDSSYEGRTDSSGVLKISDVPNGTHTVRATKSGYEEDREDISVTENRTVTLYLSPSREGEEKVRIQFRTFDKSTNATLSGVEIFINGNREGTTDSSGQLIIDTTLRSFDLRATKEGYQTVEDEIQIPGDSDIHIQNIYMETTGVSSIGDVNVNLSTDTELILVGDTITITVTVINEGNTDAKNVKVEVSSDETFEIIDGSLTWNYDLLQPGSSESKSLKFKVNSSGDRSIVAYVTYSDNQGKEYQNSNSVIIHVLSPDTTQEEQVDHWIDLYRFLSGAETQQGDLCGEACGQAVLAYHGIKVSQWDIFYAAGKKPGDSGELNAPGLEAALNHIAEEHGISQRAETAWLVEKIILPQLIINEINNNRPVIMIEPSLEHAYVVVGYTGTVLAPEFYRWNPATGRVFRSTMAFPLWGMTHHAIFFG